MAGEGVRVSIMGKDFVVACRDDERRALHSAARYLDEKMREIHESGRVIGAERCAVMAALNMAHELLLLRGRAAATPELDNRVEVLHNKICKALREESEPEL